MTPTQRLKLSFIYAIALFPSCLLIFVGSSNSSFSNFKAQALMAQTLAHSEPLDNPKTRQPSNERLEQQQQQLRERQQQFRQQYRQELDRQRQQWQNTQRQQQQETREYRQQKQEGVYRQIELQRQQRMQRQREPLIIKPVIQPR